MYSSPIWEQIGKQPNANPTDGILTAGKIAVLQNQKPFTVQSVVTLRCFDAPFFVFALNPFQREASASFVFNALIGTCDNHFFT